MDQKKTMLSFSKVVTTSGTEVRLQTESLVVDKIDVTCDINNTGDVVVGDSSVAISGTKGSTVGQRLVPGQTVRFEKIDIKDLWFDAANNGDAVHGNYTY